MTDLTAVSVTSTSHSCETSSGTDTVEEYAAGSSGLQNLGGGNYQFNWQTDKNYADSCRQVNINLGDNIPHTARFMFT